MHTIYKLTNSQDPILLNLKIGYGQRGATSLYLGTNLIGQYDDDINNLNIGSNDTLKGQSLNIYTTVHDINPATNQTSVEFSLTGGEKPVNWPPILMPAANGAVAYYSIVVNFY